METYKVVTKNGLSYIVELNIGEDSILDYLTQLREDDIFFIQSLDKSSIVIAVDSIESIAIY